MKACYPKLYILIKKYTFLITNELILIEIGFEWHRSCGKLRDLFKSVYITTDGG